MQEASVRVKEVCVASPSNLPPLLGRLCHPIPSQLSQRQPSRLFQRNPNSSAKFLMSLPAVSMECARRRKCSLAGCAFMRYTTRGGHWRCSWRCRRCILCWLICHFVNPIARWDDGGLLKVTSYRIVVLLPIREFSIAAETSDSIRIDVAVVQSSGCHCRREGFYVQRPGVERMKPLVPCRHIICWSMIIHGVDNG